jgi:Family of unknown function (DUF5678)
MQMIPVKTFNQELLTRIPPGTWVAISQDQERVVGKGLTIEDALAEAKKNGEPEPFIIRVPEGRSSLIL